jgi:hypothetical protein
LFYEIDFPDENNIEFPEPKKTICNMLSTPHNLSDNMRLIIMGFGRNEMAILDMGLRFKAGKNP